MQDLSPAPEDAGAKKGLSHCWLAGILVTWDPHLGAKGDIGGNVKLPQPQPQTSHFHLPPPVGGMDDHGPLLMPY